MTVITRVFSPLFAALLFGAAWPAALSAQQRIIDIRQGTDIAVALSPDGDMLVVDLLGQLWTLPATGGGATPITPLGERARQPRLSPDGRYVAYQRRLPEGEDIWLIDLLTGARRALTTDYASDRYPEFGPGGESVIFASNRGGSFDLWSISLADKTLTQLTTEEADAFFPTVSSSREIAYVRHDRQGWSLRSLSRDFGNLELYRSAGILSAPSWRPGGGVLVFNERLDGATRLRLLLLSDERVLKTLASNEDVFDSRAAWISPEQYIYAADGQIWRRRIASLRRDPVHLFASIGVDEPSAPAFDRSLDSPGPYRATVAAVATLRGDTTVLAALGDLWVSERDGLRQLTDDGYVETDLAPFPDDRRIVFASDRDDTGHMNLWTLDLPSGVFSQLTATAEKSYRPAVDGAGRRVAYLETSGFGPWASSRLQVLDLGTGDVETLCDALIDARRPVWTRSDDGERLEVTYRVSADSGRLETLTFDESLMPVGSEVRAARPAEPVAPGVAAGEWSWARQAGHYVVQVGRLFDGIRGTYQRHVDVHIRDGRIEAIVGRGVRELPSTVIDATDHTMLPGFVDVHAHQSDLAGERLGRAWLAHGITTVRELAFDVDEAVARAEAWASGRRVGPRLVVSPAGGTLPSDHEPGPIAMLSGGALLSGPLHHPDDFSYSANARDQIADPRRLVAGLARESLGFELRYSPLQRRYQDVYGTIIDAGYVSLSSLAAMGGLGAPIPPRARAYLEAAGNGFYDAEEETRWRGRANEGSIGASMETVARFVRAGGRVAIGSDAPAVPYGRGFQTELLLLAEAGIPHEQILRMATAQGALALGLDHEIGTLEPGRLADYLIVDGDPLARIEDAARIVSVARGGIRFEREELLGRRSR
jgi:Tol biopolymer transport system component